jgi:hypothetical protein
LADFTKVLQTRKLDRQSGKACFVGFLFEICYIAPEGKMDSGKLHTAHQK